LRPSNNNKKKAINALENAFERSHIKQSKNIEYLQNQIDSQLHHFNELQNSIEKIKRYFLDKTVFRSNELRKIINVIKNFDARFLQETGEILNALQSVGLKASVR